MQAWIALRITVTCPIIAEVRASGWGKPLELKGSQKLSVGTFLVTLGVMKRPPACLDNSIHYCINKQTDSLSRRTNYSNIQTDTGVWGLIIGLATLLVGPIIGPYHLVLVLSQRTRTIKQAYVSWPTLLSQNMLLSIKRIESVPEPYL